MQHNTDISLNVKKGAVTRTTLDEVIKKLKKIEKMTDFELNITGKGANEEVKTIEKITKEKAKQLKLTEQEIQLKTKLITAERLQYSEAAKEAERLLNLNKEKNVITRKQWLNLQKITEEDKLSVDISKKQISANEMIKKQDEQKLTTEVKINKLKAKGTEAEIKKQNITKQTLRDQKHLLDMMTAKISGKTGYEKLTNSITKYQNKLKLGKKLTKDNINSLQLLNAQMSKNGKTADITTMSLQSLLMVFGRISGVVGGILNEIGEIDESIYNLGVVSGKSAVGVEVLKRELVLAATAIPKSATDIAKSMDLVVRTGKSLQEAQELTQSSMKLAIASGKNLCPRKTSLIAGTSSKFLNTNSRQKCA